MKSVRKAAVSGWFYPSNPKALKNNVEDYLGKAECPPIEGKLKALVVPHAGYQYSGLVAAHAYKVLKVYCQKQTIRRIIMIGPAHRTWVEGLVLDPNDYWETPLGRVPVFHNGFPKSKNPHVEEHCLEVQLPFLQLVMGQFEIMPIVVGELNEFESAVMELKKYIDEDTILLVSSDLSHFHQYEDAVGLDCNTIAAFKAMDIDRFSLHGDACGKKPMLILMEMAKSENWNCRLLSYMNSGDISGDHSSVVGYASFAFYH